MVHWESIHELNAYRLLDANPAVVSFCEQPLIIRFILNGKEHRHYPDVLVNLVATSELWEIKPDAEAADPRVIARTHFLKNELPQKGFSYHMVTGEDLGREPRLLNVLTLLKHGRRPISVVEREQVRLLLQGTNRITWNSALKSLGHNRSRLLSRLFLEGEITCDIEQKLSPTTKFFSVKPSKEQ